MSSCCKGVLIAHSICVQVEYVSTATLFAAEVGTDGARGKRVVIEMRGVLLAVGGRFVSPSLFWQQFNPSGTKPSRVGVDSFVWRGEGVSWGNGECATGPHQTHKWKWEAADLYFNSSVWSFCTKFVHIKTSKLALDNFLPYEYHSLCQSMLHKLVLGWGHISEMTAPLHGYFCMAVSGERCFFVRKMV